MLQLQEFRYIFVNRYRRSKKIKKEENLVVNEDGSLIGWGKLGDTSDTGMNLIKKQ